jgi:hypothetical protein
MMRRIGLVLLAIVLAVLAGGIGWRWQGQTLDVVIVNASGTVVQFSWQPRPFADQVTVAMGGCQSKSIQLRGGDTWRFTSDRLDVDSSSVSVPLLTRDVAVEIWLAPDGSSRLVPAYPDDRPVDAPYPTGCVTQAG